MKQEFMIKKEINLLDKVKFTDKEDKSRSFCAIITELSYYNNFKNAIEDIGIKKVLPNAKSLKDGIDIYNKFPHGEGGTFKDGAKKYGVFARMKFNLI